MANNPTVVIGSLNDDELKKSIDKLVSHVDKQLNYMVSSTKVAVMSMQNSLKSLGDTKIDFGGAANGGATKRTKAQNEETAAIKESTQAYKDKKMALDQMASSQQVAIRSANPSGIRNADTLQTMNIQLDLLRERLREARQQYSSFVALAAHATTTGDKGLFQYATDGVHRYEQEVRSLIPQIRGLQDGIQQMGNVLAPQGHTIQNYVNSLQKANPELAQLNEQFKSGQSLLQQQKSSFVQNAQAQHNSANATNQTRQSLDALNAAVAQNTRKEDERRIAIIRSGQAAQESLARIKQNAQIELAENTGKPISGLKELTSAIREMERAYWDMSSYGKESPIGQSLKADIEYARKLKTAIEAYNRTLGGFSVIGNKDGVNNTLGSYSELSMLLKTLADDYKKLGREERNAAKGNDLADKIQRLGRATQKIQQQMNRPISFAAAMKGDEKTLDDIAYKMQRLRSYRQGIDLTKPNAANEIRQVDEALAKLQKDADKWMSKSQEMIKNNTALGRSWNYMKNRLAFYFTVGASTQFVKNLIEVRSQYEMNERALGILIDSAERGTQIFNELSQMALVSPYTLIELSSAAKQLTAYDVAARDVVDTTRRLADMAAAVGIPIERLTYALGQIKAYGYLNSRDARMFANAGIPLVKQLSDYYTELEGRLVSTADVYDRIKKKSIDYNEVMEVMYKMTDQGGKFFDFQAKMADTLKVRLANLTLAWNNMLNDMGKESQGVLTWGIGALRDLFLQWKQLDKLIKDAALAVGVRTLLVALRAATIGLGSFGKAMTWNAILGKKLGGIVVGLAKSFGTLFSSRLTWFALLAMAAVEATQALFGVNEAQKALNESIRNGAKDNYNNISKFLEQYQEVRDSLYAANAKGVHRVFADNLGKTVTADKDNNLVPDTQIKDIDNNEAKKAWEAIREQIELTVASSDKYIGNLLSISNMSERVRQGFNLLDDVQVVNAALKELDDDTIKVSKDLSAWWNAWQAPDGLIGNLKDYQKTLNDIIAEYGTLESFRENTFLGGKGSDDLNDYETALERFRDDLQKTTDSIINFIELKGWSGDEGKINQVFEQITQKLVLDNQLDPQKAFTLQTEVEEARSKAAKQALLQRINDERAALKISNDDSVREALAADVERYNHWEETNGRSKVEWERFTKWLKEQHISETTAMFRNMDAEDIKSLNFQEGKHAEWVTRMVTQYAKEHKMSYDEAFSYLRSWVRSANQWSVFIPLVISTEDKKSVYDQLGEYDKAVDEADAQIERLTKRINELNAKKEKSKEETQQLADAERELADAQKAKADAEAKGGHGKKEKKDERAANKAAKQEESELAKALKDELSTIEKVRSIYKDLTKEGMSHANAVERATRGWDETVNAINRVLQKNGLKKLNLADFVGIDNPREILKTLQAQLDELVKRGAKPAEIKELQTKIQTLSVDADKYDLTKITKGLNSELDRLKEEYELAVSLDADPELGSIFADWMGIDMDNLPRTAEEYAKRYTDELNSKLKEYKADLELPNLLNITDDDLRELQKRVGTGNITQKYVDDITKGVKAVRDVFSKELTSAINNYGKLLDKYGEYVVKVRRIEEEAATERKDLVMRFGNKQQKSKGLQLHTEILEEEDPVARQKLVDDLENLTNEVSKANPVALKINAAIGNSQNEKLAQASFEEFQKSREWVIATGDLATLSRSALGMLIREIEKYKKTAKNLTPKQIKAINNTLKQLKREVRKNNPFAILKNTIEDSKERMAGYQSDMDAVMRKIVEYEKKIGDRKPTEDEQKDLDALKKEWEDLYEKMKAIGSNGWDGFLQGLSAAMEMAKQATSMFTDMFSAFGNDKVVRDINRVFSILDKTMQGAMMGTAIAPGYGTIIGAGIGLISGLVTTFADQWSGNKAITERVQESERAVKELVNAFKMLEYAAEQAFGTAVLGAKEAIKANKELQLVELKRQLILEQSRSSKRRDDDKITDLKGQIIELENEIRKATKETLNDLLGISSHGDFFEDMISEMINAFKKGEDAMNVFKEKWSQMIDNMIMKTIVSKVLQDWINSLEKGAENIISKYTQAESEAVSKHQEFMANTLQQDDGDLTRWIYENDKKAFNDILKQLGAKGMRENINSMDDLVYNSTWFDRASDSGLAKKIADMYKANMQSQLDNLNNQLDKASLDATGELIDYYGKAGEDFKANYLDVILDKIKENWNFGQDSENKLSQLQQGIQGITEDQAGALEAYWNANTQQQYVQSDLLREIRNLLAGGDADIQTGVQAQMLLQLQQSYQVQMSIENILQGALNPSGRAFSVQLIS